MKVLNLVLAASAATFGLAAAAQSTPPPDAARQPRAVYSSQMDAKAKGLLITFEYPSEWKRRLGTRDTMLVQFSSPTPDGTTYCSFEVKDVDVPPGHVMSREEARRMWDPAIVGAGSLSGHFFDGRPITIDGLAAGIVEFTTQTDTMRVHAMMQSVYYDRRMLVLTCGLAGASQKAVDERFGKYRPLFEAMGKTIAIHNKLTADSGR